MADTQNNFFSEAISALESNNYSQFALLYQDRDPIERAAFVEALPTAIPPTELVNKLVACFTSGNMSACIPLSEITLQIRGPALVTLKIRYVAMIFVDTLRYYREAINIMEKVLDIEPSERDTLWNLGQYGYWSGPDLQESAKRSIRCYRKLIEIGEADVSELYLRIAGAYAELLDYAEAKTNYLAAKEANPELAERVDNLVADLEVLQNAARQDHKPIIARYPNQQQFKQPLQDFIFADASTLFRDVQLIRPTTRFFTIGSCFAQNICHFLLRRGYSADTIPYSEHINSTHANRILVDWLLGDTAGDNPNFPKIEKYVVGEARRSREELLEGLRNCDVFIYSLGVAAGFFRQDDGSFVMPGQTELNQRALTSTFRFRTTTVEENVANLRYILSRLSEVNPSMRVVLTVSPVPLRVSFQHHSAMLTDCISKSTLRVACNEVVQQAGSRCLYWPSFEYVRWLSGHTRPSFGVDDDNPTHVSIDFLDSILHTFLKVFSCPEGKSA